MKTLGKFYDLVEHHVTELGLTDKPQTIFNCDESGFQSFASRGKVFCDKKKPKNKMPRSEMVTILGS